MADRMHVPVGFFDQPAVREVFDQLLAALEAVQSFVGSGRGVHNPVIVHDVDRLQVVAQADFKVVRVVRRSDFHATGSEFGFDIFICNHRNFSAENGKNQRFADQILVAFIARADGHGHIAEHRLRAGGGNDHPALFAFDRVANVIERPFGFDMLAFFIRQGRGTARAPVDNPVSPVNQSFLVQPAEHFLHRPAEAFIHGEAFTIPVAGTSQFFQLVDNGAAIVLLPRPDLFQKGFALKIVAARPLFRQLALDDVLRGDSRVVGARHPQRVFALHAPPADEHILNGIIERVAHVQNTGHIRRRNHDGGRIPGLRRVHCKGLFLQPLGVPLFFNRFRIVVFWKFTHIHKSSVSKQWKLWS